MKTIMAILLAVLFLSTAASFCEEAKKEQEYDFRKADWGMDRQEVIKTEKTLILKGNTKELYYYLELEDLTGLVKYSFVYDELVEGQYQIFEPYTKEERCIESYNTLKSYFTEEYGDPIEDKKEWKDPRYKEKEKQWGFAVYLGFLEYESKWETETTDIKLYLKLNNNTIEMRAIFKPRPKEKKKRPNVYPYAS